MKKKKSEDFVIICPNCYSTDVEPDFSNAALVESGMFINAKKCNNCGFKSDFFLEIEKNKLPKVRIPTKKRELVNPKYYSTVNWALRIISPIALLISLILIISGTSEMLLFSLVNLLPFSIAITIVSYKENWIKKYKILRIICLLIFIYSFTLGPYFYVWILSKLI